MPLIITKYICFRLKCEYLGIDIQDDMGRHEVGFVENTIKTPLGADGEGCLFEARFHINKVALSARDVFKLEIQAFEAKKRALEAQNKAIF